MRRASAAWRRPWRPTVEADVGGRRGGGLRGGVQRVAGGRIAGGRGAAAWRATVEADVDGRRGRRLRRAITRVTRDHIAGLGVTPPGHLLVAVQRTVELDERPLASLLQVFEDAEGRRRNVLFLALTAGGREMDDGDLLATLRQQLQRVVSGELGTPVSLARAAAETGPEAAPAGARPGGGAGGAGAG